jgi:hypothetical protein
MPKTMSEATYFSTLEESLASLSGRVSLKEILLADLAVDPALEPGHHSVSYDSTSRTLYVNAARGVVSRIVSQLLTEQVSVVAIY